MPSADELRLNKLTVELFEQILFYLYEFRNDGEFHDILDKFKEHPTKVLYSVTRELSSKKMIHWNSGLRIITGDNSRSQTNDTIKVKILIDGINYVRQNLLKKENPKVNDPPKTPETDKQTWDIENVDKLLLDSFKHNSEIDLLKAMKDNSFLFYFLFTRKGGAQPIFREVELGSKLRCDFCWLNDNTDGPEWVLVEIEKPHMKIFTANKKPTAELNAALEQVKTWQRYFKDNPAEKSKIFGAVAKFRYILVAGDKDSWATEEAMKWRSHNNETTDFEIRTTDVFIRAINEFKKNPSDFWSFKRNPKTWEFKKLEDYWKNYGYMDNMRKIYN